MWYKFRRSVVMRQRKCTTKVGEVYHKFRRGVPLIVTKIRSQPATHVKDIQRKCPTNFGEVSCLRFWEALILLNFGYNTS